MHSPMHFNGAPSPLFRSRWIALLGQQRGMPMQHVRQFRILGPIGPCNGEGFLDDGLFFRVCRTSGRLFDGEVSLAG